MLDIARYIPSGSKVADIGTDHAVLPIHLVRCGLADSAIATDINKKPLMKAAENIDAVGLSDAIELRLGNGLACISPNEVDTIVIAGMGGELIADILAAAPWLRSGSYKLILQPMSRSERLREYLAAQHFTPLAESAGMDAGRHYTVIVAETSSYSGDYPDFFAYAGLLGQSNIADDKAYLAYTADLLRRRAEMIPQGRRQDGLFCELTAAAEYIEGCLK